MINYLTLNINRLAAFGQGGQLVNQSEINKKLISGHL